MEGKATGGPYVAVQSGRAAPLSTPALISGRCANTGPPTWPKPRSASVARRSPSPGYDGGSDSSAPTRDGKPSSPSLGTAQESAPHSSLTLGGDHLRGRATNPSPRIVADPPKVSSWQTVASFDGHAYGQDYLRFSAGALVELLRHCLEDDDWAYGRLLETQEEGWLPRSFVDRVEQITRREEPRARHYSPMPGGDHLRGRANNPPPPIVADPPKVSCWQTVAFFDGSYYGQDCLRFSAGALVELLRDSSEHNGWAYGRLVATQEKGWLPRNFVDSVEKIMHREESGPPHNAPLSDPGTRVFSDQQER